jgi:hypothetical protein
MDTGGRKPVVRLPTGGIEVPLPDIWEGLGSIECGNGRLAGD